VLQPYFRTCTVSSIVAGAAAVVHTCVTCCCSWDRSPSDISSCAEVERVVLKNKGRLEQRLAGGEPLLFVECAASWIVEQGEAGAAVGRV
jgi:hypothetical protein